MEEGIGTVKARALGKILRGLHELGVEPEPILAEVGLARVDPADAEARIPFVTYARLLERAAEATGRPDFGLEVARGAKGQSFGVMGYAAMASPTLGEAMVRVATFHHVWNDAAEVRLVRGPELATLTYAIASLPPEEIRQDVEHSLMLFVHPFREGFGIELPVEEVRFRHPPPDDTHAHRAAFGAATRLRFDAEDNAVVFRDELLARPSPGFDPTLLAHFDERAQQELDRLAGGPITRRLRELLAQSLSAGHTELSRLAGRLGMSERTLQRRLREEGTEYTVVLEELRKRLARAYLRRSDTSLDEVALMLGYSEISAFSRAFRRHFGVPPGEWRRTHLES